MPISDSLPKTAWRQAWDKRWRFGKTSRGVPRVDDRRVLNGILRFRTGAPWRDIPERYGPRTTLYNRFVRWRKAGVWDRLLDVVSRAYDGEIVMIDWSCVRVHQHGAAPKKAAGMVAWDGRRGPRLFGGAG